MEKVKFTHTDRLKIGERIRKRRKECGYTRETFAELIDVSVKFCSDIELGVKGFSIETLLTMCKVLNVSPSYILLECNSRKNVDARETFKVLIDCLDDYEFHVVEEVTKSLIHVLNEKR